MMNLTHFKKTKTMFVWLFLIFQYHDACLAADIAFQRVPDAGIQPVLVSDRQGDTHLLYFKVEDASTGRGRFYYRRFDESRHGWSAAIQVSTNPYQRPHLIARASMAVDDSRRIHVTWHQDNPVDDYPTSNGSEYLPDYLYTRAREDVPVFEPERSIVREFITEAETGAALVVHDNSVSLIWHGSGPDDAETESAGSVYRIVSLDNGTTFGKEEMIGDQSLGACGCCGLSAGFNRAGKLQVAYRTAVANDGRHMQLLEVDPGKKSKTRLLHAWQLSACPVSTNHIARDRDGNNHLVFETRGLIYQVDLGTGAAMPGAVSSPASRHAQKHPAIAINNRNEKLIVWNEGVGINGGGVLRWQLFNPKNVPVPPEDKEERTVAEYSAPAVISFRDGNFLVLY